MGIIPPGIINIFLPAIGSTQYGSIGPVASAAWVFIVGYSVIKYRQMNVKVVTAEMLVITMIIVTFLNIFTDFSFGIYGRIILFAVFALIGYFLIKSLIRESIQREELKDLNENLEKKVSEQTLEIRKAYEVEKKARTELQKLDQNKNDFIIITQHHLRTPLTRIKWYAGSILSGLYGTISTDLGGAISQIDKSCERLIKTVNNFLDITQLRIGAKILKISSVNLKNIIESLLEEFAKEIRDKGLNVKVLGDIESWPLVKADEERIKDVFSVIIENAIQYNKEGGEILINAERNKKMIEVTVSNTGIGMSEDDRKRLFKQSFFRSKEAKLANPLGMGVGLLVAKTIVEAHGGKIGVGVLDANKVSVKVGLCIN